MADVNQGIIVATIGITAVGIVKSVSGPEHFATPGGGAEKTPRSIGNVLVGGYVLALVASVIDLAGGAASRLVGGVMMVALFASVLYLFGTPLFQNIGGWLSGNTAAIKPPGTLQQGGTIS